MKVRILFYLLIISSFAFSKEKERIIFRAIKFSITFEGVSGIGRNVPYYHHSLRHGVSSLDPNSGYTRASVVTPMNDSTVWSWGAGVDLVGAVNHFNPFYVQQAYVEGRWKFLDLMIGAKEFEAEMRNQALSSGGTAWSGNSRPIPQIRAGVFDFYQLTWAPIQIKGYIAYGKHIDDRYKKKNYNYINYGILTDYYYNIKALFLRSPERYPLRGTFGLEGVCRFSGTYEAYQNGELIPNLSYTDKLSFRKIISTLYPLPGGKDTPLGEQNFFYGSNLGTAQFNLEYEFKNHRILKIYHENFFNDGSGMTYMNQGDGLWGIELDNSKMGAFPLVQGAVLEFFKSTGQSGMVNWRWMDAPGSGPISHSNSTFIADGTDDYYNHDTNPYTHFGQVSGNPLIQSPIYNKDGYLNIVNNRILSLSGGINGYLTREWEYRLKGHAIKAFGSGKVPISFPVHSISGMMEIIYSPLRLKGWKATGSFSFDAGDMYGNNLGFLVGIRKSGKIF